MKKSDIRNTIYLHAVLLAIISSFTSNSVFAGSYTRVENSNIIAAPIKNNNETRFAYNGLEAAPNAYGYISNLPNDGNWRYIEARCYKSSAGNVCVNGHWVRKKGSNCEEVSNHSVKQGNYTRIISAGSAPSCRASRPQ